MMFRILALASIFLSLAISQASAERLNASGIRKAVIGDWSGSWKKASIALSIRADGTVTGRYNGIPASGSWTTTRASDGDRICLTFRAIVSDTKCGELYRKGNSVLYGYPNRGKPRLWLRRN